MLHQNWFCVPTMIKVDEYYERQLFYDITSKCFYKVEENESGQIVITEISKEDNVEAFNELMSEYQRDICEELC